MSDRIHELRKSRAATADRMALLVDLAETESRDLNFEETDAFAKLESEVSALTGRIDRAERAAKLQADSALPVELAPAPMPDATPAQAPAVHVRESRPYSLIRAIRAQLSSDWSDAKVEKRASSEIAEVEGRAAQGLFVPWSAMVEQRAEVLAGTVAAPGTGGAVVPLDLYLSEFIEFLRANTVSINAGARVLTGLTGNVDIPRQATGASATWLAEGGDTVDSGLTTDKVELSPKTVGLFTDISRRMLKQASPEIENLVRADIGAAIGGAVDTAVLRGTGASNQPEGILTISGTGTVTTGGISAITWAMAVEYETDVSTANALAGSLAFVTTPSAIGSLKTKLKAASTSATYLMEDGRMNGYPVFATTELDAPDESDGEIIFGDFSQVLIGMWGGLDIIADPFSLNSGSIRIRGFQDMDVGIRHAAAFSVSEDL